MIHMVKGWLVSGAAAIGARRARKGACKRALIIPPAGPGSVGDAAMLTSIVRALRARRFDQVDILQVQPGTRWDLDCPEDNLVPGADFIDYGSRINLAAILLTLGGYSDVYCIGADILDGIYDEEKMANRLELVHRAAAMGLKATIVGSSFSEHPTSRCVALIRALPAKVRVLARDEYSHARMTRTLGRKIELCADVAFLLEATEQTIAPLPEVQWFEAERAGGRSILAINANNLHEPEHPELIKDYAQFAAALIGKGCSLLMIPHDTRTERSDQFIADQIVASLDAASAPHAMTFRTATPGQLKAVLARVDLIVTGRMHAAIIALGSHTPAMSFAYANKFEGLYRHLELDPETMILTLDDLHAAPDAVAERVLIVHASAAQLRQHIAGKIGLLKLAAARNFDDELKSAA